jgi:DNA-binding YbaB/EbfC family protein
MFKELGAVMNLMKNKGKLEEEMQKFKSIVPTITAEGSSGGGMVTVKVNGRLEVMSMKISEDAFKMNDRELVEDLTVAAVNQALAKVRELLAAETAKMAGNMGLPPGMMDQLGGMTGS